MKSVYRIKGLLSIFLHAGVREVLFFTAVLVGVLSLRTVNFLITLRQFQADEVYRSITPTVGDLIATYFLGADVLPFLNPTRAMRAGEYYFPYLWVAIILVIILLGSIPTIKAYVRFNGANIVHAGSRRLYILSVGLWHLLVAFYAVLITLGVSLVGALVYGLDLKLQTTRWILGHAYLERVTYQLYYCDVIPYLVIVVLALFAFMQVFYTLAMFMRSILAYLVIFIALLLSFCIESTYLISNLLMMNRLETHDFTAYLDPGSACFIALVYFGICLIGSFLAFDRVNLLEAHHENHDK